MLIPTGHVAIRLLCRLSRVGSLIGLGGISIRQIQQETSAKILVEDSPPNSADEHRVILIIGSASLTKKITLSPSNEEIEVSAAEEAAVRVFERVEVESVRGPGKRVEGFVKCRMLVETVIRIAQKPMDIIRKNTKCKIKILNKETLRACSLPYDEVVKLEGDTVVVKKAIIALSRYLQDCPRVNKERMKESRCYEIVQQNALLDSKALPLHRSSVAQVLPTSSTSNPSRGQSVFLEGDRVAAMETETSLREVVFNILCPNDILGEVIGKGGSIVRIFQNETGASISVGPNVADCVERLITISAMENPESQNSAAQSAVVLVFSRLAAAAVGKELYSCSKGLRVSARLVVQTNEVGCLLGVRGTIISEIRKVTGAGLRIIGGNQVPDCATGDVGVVEITGAFVNVRKALYSVTGRLRDKFLALKMPNGTGFRSGLYSSFTENSPYGMVRRPPLRFHPSVDVSHALDQQSALAQCTDKLRFNQNTNRPPSPKLWTAQTVTGANQRRVVDVGRGLTSVEGSVEIDSRRRSAIETNTTVEIVVPDDVINLIYGENARNLSYLRQFSGAKVIVFEPRPGSTDRTIVISGTPDQTWTAQRLLQAFILRKNIQSGTTGRQA